MIISSSTRFSSICFSVHSLIVSHDDDSFYFYILVLLLSGFLYVLRVFIHGTCFYSRYATLDFGIGGSCSFVGGF